MKYFLFDPHPDVWVVYTDQDHEGSWSGNGEDTKLTLKFQVNESSNSGGAENCLHMEHKEENFLFNYVNYVTKQRFICQKTEIINPPSTLYNVEKIRHTFNS